MPAPPSMSDAQAALEALRRWGQDARAWHPPYDVPGGQSYCLVGSSNGRLFAHQWAVFGGGASWTEAFREASERGH